MSQHQSFLSGISKSVKQILLQNYYNFLAPSYVKLSRHDLQPRQFSDPVVVLVLGSNDLAPVDQALTVIQKLNVSLVITSGLGGHPTKRASIFTKTEAETYADLLVQNGYNGSIYVEKTSRSTGGNILNSHEWIQAQSLEAKHIVIIQTPAAQLRANLTFEHQWKSSWNSYESCPAHVPQIHQLSDVELDWEFAYTLREIASILLYMYHPPKYVADYPVPQSIIDSLIHLYCKYEHISFPKDHQSIDIASSITIAKFFRETIFDSLKNEFLATQLD